MILIADVQYGETNWAAGLVYDHWKADKPRHVYRVDVGPVDEYQPGEFYRRELPALLKIIEGSVPVTTVVIDGYVNLPDRPGLGAHLHFATGLPVLGIAKKYYEGINLSAGVLRGKSEKPLWVTAVGVDNPQQIVRELPGQYRLPEWVKLADQTARGYGISGEHTGLSRRSRGFESR